MSDIDDLLLREYDEWDAPPANPCVECGKLCVPNDGHKCKPRKVRWESMCHNNTRKQKIWDEDSFGYGAMADG